MIGISVIGALWQEEGIRTARGSQEEVKQHVIDEQFRKEVEAISPMAEVRIGHSNKTEK